MFDKVLDRINGLDEKIDTKTDRIYNYVGECKTEINQCKVDVSGVQKDLTNHLNNKKSETEAFKFRTKIAFGVIGVIFTVYATIKELL